MARIRVPSSALALALAAGACVPGHAAAGTVRAGGSQAAVSLEASDAPFSAVRDALAGFGLALHAAVPEDRTVTVSFALLPPREAAARIGTALGGLEPLQVTWEAGAGRSWTEHFLVRGATPARRALEALCLPGGGFAKAQLQQWLAERGAALLPDLEEVLASATAPAGRARAVGLIGRIEGARAEAALLAHLRADPAPLAREAAAVALGARAIPAGRDALRAALRDPDRGVSLAAAWALIRLGDGAGVPLALASLADADPALALRAADVVEETGDPGHLAALEDAAAGAPSALARGRARAAAAVVRAAGGPDAARAAALEPLLADPAPEVRHFARASLARLEAPAALAALERAAADPASPGRLEAAGAAAALRRGAEAPPGPVVE